MKSYMDGCHPQCVQMLSKLIGEVSRLCFAMSFICLCSYVGNGEGGMQVWLGMACHKKDKVKGCKDNALRIFKEDMSA